MINLLMKDKLNYANFKEKTSVKKMSEVYKAFKSINNKLIKYKKNELTIMNIFGLFQNYIWSKETKLDEALINAVNFIENNTNNYENKIVVMITDGKSNNGGSLEAISKKLKKIKNAYLVVIFISSEDSKRPGELFYSAPTNFRNEEKDLFEATSVIDAEKIFFSNKNLIIPKDKQIKLFIQGNDKVLINAIFESMKNFIDNNELLLFNIGNEQLNEYLGKEIKDFTPQNQGNEGTCYAYASATAIHLTLLGFYGTSSDSFIDIKDRIKETYKNNKITQNILKTEEKKYNFKMRVVNETGAKEAIINNHICVSRFELTEVEWSKFKIFFGDKNKTGILSKELLQKTSPNYTYINSLSKEQRENITGHAVVLISAKNGYLRFLNSWGKYFGDHGFFSIENSNVLRQMEFYEIYIDENDLNEKEKSIHEEFIKKLSVKYFKNSEKYNKLLEEEIECDCPNQKCHKPKKIKEFKGSFDTVKCPICKQSYQTKNAKIIEKLFFEFINK